MRSLPSPPPLDYAPPPAWHRRRWVKRSVIVVAVALLVFGSAYKFGPLLWRQSRILYWQGRCLRYEPPQGKIVYHRRRADRTSPSDANVSSTKSVGYVPPQ